MAKLLLDPTGERSVTERTRLARPASLSGHVVGLLDISKPRGNVFLDRLEELKAIKKGRIPVAIVGNRVKARTRAAAGLDRFLAGVGHTVVTRLRDSQLYADAAAQGLAVLDLTGSRPRDVRGDWAPLLAWIESVV